MYVSDRGACICRAALQKIISLSSTEAEYIGATWCSKSVLWARVLLAELGHRQRGPTNIYIDNQSAMHLTRNPMFHERSKHIMNRFHFCREKVHAGLLNFKYISTEANPADICTKAMSTEKKHNRFTEMVLSKRFDLV